MNPARNFGPMVVTGNYAYAWVNVTSKTSYITNANVYRIFVSKYYSWLSRKRD